MGASSEVVVADIIAGDRRPDITVGLRWQHGMHVWCGLGGSAATARSRLAAVMEALYRTPFGKFERYCPCGTPAQVAAGLRPYLDAGCRSFNLIPVADSEQAAIEGTDAVRAALQEEH